MDMMTAERLARNIELMRHGGKEGTDLFLRSAREILEFSGDGALQDWITLAAPALPEKERTVVLAALISSMFKPAQPTERVTMH
jgi:hypothetical protein